MSVEGQPAAAGGHSSERDCYSPAEVLDIFAGSEMLDVISAMFFKVEPAAAIYALTSLFFE